MKTVLITGKAGQDGRFLSKFLMGKDHRIVGLVPSDREDKLMEFQRHFPDIEIATVDFQNSRNLSDLMTEYIPDEFYNLMASSSVKYSFDHPFETAQTTAIAPERLLEVLRNPKSCWKDLSDIY